LVVKRLRPYRKAGVFLALLLALGPGLIVNGLLKPNWGRPRPNQTLACGGDFEFLPVWTIGGNQDEQVCRSFPSGHASMGFYLMAPAFLFFRRRPRWTQGFMLLGLGWGGAMGLARIMQGRHFASDVLWSAACVYFTGVALLALFEFAEKRAAARTGRPVADAVLPFPDRSAEEGDRREAA